MQTSTRDEIDVGLTSLSRLDEVQDYLLDSITELMGAVDRSILDAASVFRDRFTDEALAHVSGNTRGTVADASRYFVRFHVATRSRDGDVAFFHASVRDYIYARLDDGKRQQLHRRAADWYDRVGNLDEATYHEQMAELVPVLEHAAAAAKPAQPAGSGPSAAGSAPSTGVARPSRRTASRR
jgi:ATP/maltotriose-dependent transcriptional regulator MalT